MRDNFIFDSSLVLSLPLYQLDGASFMSKGAYGHKAVVTGALWTPSGREFDGVDDYISSGLVTAKTPCTFELWAKISGGDVDKGICLLGGPTSHTGLSFRIQYWVIVGDEVRSTYRFFQRYYKMGDSLWHHIVWYISGTDIGDSWIRLDTELLAIEDTTGGTAFDAWTDFVVGKGAWGAMPGIIGEWRVYTRELSALEIQHLYLSTKWRYK